MNCHTCEVDRVTFNRNLGVILLNAVVDPEGARSCMVLNDTLANPMHLRKICKRNTLFPMGNCKEHSLMKTGTNLEQQQADIHSWFSRYVVFLFPVIINNKRHALELIYHWQGCQWIWPNGFSLIWSTKTPMDKQGTNQDNDPRWTSLPYINATSEAPLEFQHQGCTWGIPKTPSPTTQRLYTA